MDATPSIEPDVRAIMDQFAALAAVLSKRKEERFKPPPEDPLVAEASEKEKTAQQ